MNDDDLDELEGDGYQNVENDPFARRSSHHTQRRSQMPGRSPKKPPSTGIPGAKGNPNAAAQSADGQKLQNKVKQGQESNSKIKNPFSKKKDKDKDKDSKDDTSEEDKDAGDMIGEAVKKIPLAVRLKIAGIAAISAFAVFLVIVVIALVCEVLGEFGITSEIATTFHQLDRIPEKDNENEGYYDDMVAYYEALDKLQLDYQKKCEVSVIDKNYIHGALLYRYYGTNNYEDLGSGEIYKTMKGHLNNVATLMVEDCSSDIENIFLPNLTDSNWLKIYYVKQLEYKEKEEIVQDIVDFVIEGIEYKEYYYGDLDNIKVTQGTCKQPYTHDYMNGNESNSTITFKEYVMGIPYGEVGNFDFVAGKEAIKALMIAGQSYALSRSEWKPGDDSMYVHNGNCWQLSCKIDEGCSYKYEDAGGYGTCYTGKTGQGSYHPPLDPESEKYKLIEQYYDEIRGIVMFNTLDNTIKRASYLDSYKTEHNNVLGQQEAYAYAKQGKSYEEILNIFYNNFYLGNLTENAAAGALGGEGTFIGLGKFTYYNQGNYSNVKFCGRSNATIKSSGCGVTSMAMILANLVDSKVTPVDTMKEAYGWHYCGAGISGTDAGYFQKSAKAHNLNYVHIGKNGSMNQLAEALMSGKSLAIAHMGPGIFTSGGHYIVLAGYKDGKVLVEDPGNRSRTGKYYDLSTVRSQTKSGFYVFSPKE